MYLLPLGVEEREERELMNPGDRGTLLARNLPEGVPCHITWWMGSDWTEWAP